MRRDGCTDVRAVDDGGGLREGHDSHVYETDDHDRYGSTGLDSCRSEGSDTNAYQLVVAGVREELFEPP